MRERPILFSGAMVRAILAGRKTMTRRVVKPQPGDVLTPIRVEEYEPVRVDRNGEEYAGEPIFGAYSADGEWGVRCPYGAPGDRLWVRETFRPWFDDDEFDVVQYRADGSVRKPEGLTEAQGYHFHDECQRATDESPWRPSIFMPRWASRLTLGIVSVRVERLQEMTVQDVRAEGIVRSESDPNPTASFRLLWNQINESRRFGWDANPYVWVVTFKRVRESPEVRT